MENYDIIKIQLKSIIRCIYQYTSDPSITTILESLSNALEDTNYDIILFSCKQIKNWYQKNLSHILSNEFARSKSAHRENALLINHLVSELEANKADYQLLFGSNSKTESQTRLIDEALANLFDRFHQIVIQLRDRHANRDTLDVDDEYDVQDLLHALLKIYCDDIRPEEWTPSYGGTSSRQDFLLKNEQIVIEIKKTRKGLGNKELANELIIDMARYETHPDCKKLICFVYDPENRIKNPRGFESDLNKSTGSLTVTVYIRP